MEFSWPAWPIQYVHTGYLKNIRLLTYANHISVLNKYLNFVIAARLGLTES